MDGCLFWGLLALLSLPDLASADAVNNEWYSTTRARSMGNVGIASADDPSTAAFFNPAALARGKKTTLEVFNPQLEFGGGIFSMSGALTDMGKQSGYTKSKPLLIAHPGQASSAGYAIYPNVSSQNFSFGILASADSWSYYNRNKDAYNHHGSTLFIPTLGMSMGALGNRFRLGWAVRGVQIYETRLTEKASATSDVVEVNRSGSGFGIGLDAGVLLTLPWGGLPTIGATARNIGDTAFPMAPLVPFGPKEERRHDRIKMTYDGGFSISPKSGQNSQVTFAVDYRDITDVTKADIVRKFNAGLEFSISKVIYLRGGFSQGYATGGFGLNSKFGAFDFGTYGEELDDRGFQGFLDRRYSLRFTRRF
ncbi:MAG TPA: hypothetical protein VIH99_10685 [Bdellovibrionota bacterium]|jgi:hypothetical protein